MLRHIAASAKLTTAQAQAYLVSLGKIGLVEQVNQSGLYQLGPFALQLGLTRMRSLDPAHACNAASVFAAEFGLMVMGSVWGSRRVRGGSTGRRAAAGQCAATARLPGGVAK